MAREYVAPSESSGPGANNLIQAAGITSLIKCILMLKHNTIPPHPHEAPLNRNFPPLSERNIHIPRRSLSFHPTAKHERRRIFINNFNATVSKTVKPMIDI